jgi:hypothetical protein
LAVRHLLALKQAKLPDSRLNWDSRLLPQALMSNQAMRSGREPLAPSALVKQQPATATIRRLPEANPLRRAMLLARENPHS